MPALTTLEHEAVVSVLQQYVDSLDLMLRAHPDAQSAQAKRHQMLAILSKLQAPDPLVAAIDNAASLQARLKLRRR